MNIDSAVAVQIRDLEKTYGKRGQTQTRALKKVSFDIHKGDFLMITGRNGSGKSTFLHQVALLDNPTGGSIVMDLNGPIEVTSLPENKRLELRLREIGYVFQEYALIKELTALENVMLPSMMLRSAKESRLRAEKLLKKVDLDHKKDHLPAELSGGEQQRVAIARALVNDPHIIFADEPTANLDSIASKHVLEIFKAINSHDKITIVMVTHEPEELIYASRHIIFSDGKLASSAKDLNATVIT